MFRLIGDKENKKNKKKKIDSSRYSTEHWKNVVEILQY